ncbi:MAG: CRTAC1 family protein [Thermoguttaceae bacterium]
MTLSPRVWRLCLAGSGLTAAAAGAAALAVLVFPVLPSAAPDCSIQLADVTSRTGVSFRHTDGSGGRRYILETVSAGVATFDYDGDGLIDIYFLNGAPLQGTPWEGPPPRNALYRNLGGFRFEDVTERAGVGDTGYGLGVAVGDYDNDGDPDLYVSNFGPKVLYRNNGDGTFTDVTRQAGVADGDQVGAGASFLDIDGDGDLDLYVANYVDFSYERYVPKYWYGFHIYPGPLDFDPLRDTLFRNNGDGTFTDVSMSSGIGNHPGTGMGMVCADYDNDGDTDIFVLNDVFGNFCFQNDGTGSFQEVSVVNAFKYNGDGMAMGSMGVDCADYDNDGWLDLFQTSFEGELPALFRNLGNGALEDVTSVTGAGEGGLVNVKWGCGFADFDNDGHKDIFYVFGHIQDNLELYDDTTTYEGTPVLLRNTGDGKFVNVSDLAGSGMKVRIVGRGVALDDLDNDGRVDVVILSSRRPAVILRNESPSGNHWLQIQLRGVKTNRDGVGARVKVVAGDLVQIDEVHSGRGYQSHFGSRLHFGLANRGRVDRIEVRWLGGGVDILENIPADQLLTIREGGPAVCR